MKKQLQILMLAFFLLAFSMMSFAQTKEEIKQNKEAEKAQKKRQKQEEKEKLQRPPQIIINAKPERIREMFVGNAASQGSMIEEATDNRIVVTKRIGGWRGTLTQALVGNAYSDEPKYRIIMFLAEVEKGKTLVTISEASVVVRMALGNENKANYINDKKSRPNLDGILKNLKEQVESQEQKITAQEKTETNTQNLTQSILSADGYNFAGVELFKQNKLSEAETAFREAVRLDAYNAAYHHNLGSVYNAQGKFEDAEKEIELATRLAPNEETFKKSLEIVRANKPKQ